MPLYSSEQNCTRPAPATGQGTGLSGWQVQIYTISTQDISIKSRVEALKDSNVVFPWQVSCPIAKSSHSYSNDATEILLK